MFPFNFQLSDDFCEVFGRKSRIGFSVAMSNGRFLCLLKHLSELSITKSNLVWFSWPLFDFAEIFTSRSWIVKEKILRIGCVIAFTRKCYYRYKVNFLKRFFLESVASAWICNSRFLFTQTRKIPRKGHLNDLSNEYKIISVSKRIFSKKEDFWWALCVDKKELMSQLISSYVFCMVLAKFIELRTHLLIFDYS